jgi:hypothetical protein
MQKSAVHADRAVGIGDPADVAVVKLHTDILPAARYSGGNTRDAFAQSRGVRVPRGELVVEARRVLDSVKKL